MRKRKSKFCLNKLLGLHQNGNKKNCVGFRENCPKVVRFPTKNWDELETVLCFHARTLTLWQILDVERVFTYTLLLPFSHMLLRFPVLLKIVATAFPLTSPTTLQFHRYHCPQWVAPLHKTSTLYCPEKNIDRKTTTGKGKMRHYKIKRQLSHSFSLDFHDSTHSSFL